ncbi:probable receptor-like protein kinase At5g20050 [Magnolia sinica]|uniref:probable receptor-like protein kinase At5g20050 n=1 Tax=Magnolia sinica TaxID=86752 RepID=UPI0026599FFD|nr:probable receptor-like protein kinase At5g20050 [Magnolia sinica]
MESKRWKIVAAAIVISLLILVIVLRFSIGLCKAFFVITGVFLAVILAIFIWVFVLYAVDRWRRRSLENRKAFEGEQLRLEYSFLRRVAGLPSKFRYEELEAATDNFQALLGRGASASVFKGILDDGTPVAVKRIEGVEHGDREFRAEVTAIASVQHVNLVRLLGYCCVIDGPRFLVYEFVHNGSLDGWIFPQGNCRGGRDDCLSWSLRYRVAIDVAKALAYLHHDCRSRVLHLDVKPENILLNENFRAQVSDFGLSKLMGRDESRVVTTVRGTRGYLAPEWLLENGISEKSDVYSYGMVLLELVGGRRNVCLVGNGNNSQKKWSYFPKIVTEKVREGKIMEVLDERLVRCGGIEEREVKILVHVALWCIQEKSKLRPSMARVVDMLEGRVHVDVPPQTEMIIVDLLSIDQAPTEGPTGNGHTRPVGRQIEGQVPTTSTYSFAMSSLSGSEAGMPGVV